MTSFDVRIIRQEIGVPPIDYPRVIAQPTANLIQTDTGTDKETRESPPHGVRRYPRKVTSINVFDEWSGKIISVPILPVFYGRLKHKWLTESVVFEEEPKYVCQWDGAFLPVLEIHGGGFA